MPESYGWNDEDGTVHCAFCNWTKKCSHMEQIEHELRQHLETAHDKPLIFRVETETGKHTSIPR